MHLNRRLSTRSVLRFEAASPASLNAPGSPGLPSHLGLYILPLLPSLALPLAPRSPPGRSFFGGRAYLLTPTNFTGLSHHAVLHVAYMRMLLHVEDCFGAHVPDVAFVLTTSDTPRYVSAGGGGLQGGGVGRSGRPYSRSGVLRTSQTRRTGCLWSAGGARPIVIKDCYSGPIEGSEF
jgi:hypothetical protein